MSIKVFVIDSDSERISELKKILGNVFPQGVEEIPYSYRIEELERAIANRCPSSQKLPWLVAHHRNVQGISVEKYFSRILTYSAGPSSDQKKTVLHLDSGKEYGSDVWQKYLNSRSSTLDIFYRPKFPETLTAAYLLMIAREKKVGVPLDSLIIEQWEEACEQYKEIGGDKNADWSDALAWDEKKIGEVKEKIGRLFSPVASQTR